MGGLEGTLFSLVVEAKEKKEKSFKRLYEFEDQETEICGLFQQSLDDNTVFILIITESALFAISGDANLEELFSVYSSRQVCVDHFSY